VAAGQGAHAAGGVAVNAWGIVTGLVLFVVVVVVALIDAGVEVAVRAVKGEEWRDD
jgi:multisubunit Na+/H+ antiporter MnhE subunit